MDAANEIAAVRARLPYDDRRALSQAWFSAFHLANDGAVASVKRAFAIAPVASDERAPRPEQRSGAGRAVALPDGMMPRRRDAAAGGAAGNAGSIRRPARVAGRLDPARRNPPFRASFTLTVEDARVQILLRREGPVLHVVALCTRRHLELVRRALACADFALRAQGAGVRSSLRALGSFE